MFKKIIGVIVLVVLLSGSICGIVYGVKYNKFDSEQSHTIELQQQKIETNEKQIKQLMEEKQQIISDNMLTLEEKNTKIANLEAQIAVLKQQSGGEAELPADGVILTLNPRLASNSPGNITFTYDEVRLTNEKRCFAFNYAVNTDYRLSKITCTAPVRVEYFEGICLVSLSEENLTKSAQYYIDFSLETIPTIVPANPV